MSDSYPTEDLLRALETLYDYNEVLAIRATTAPMRLESRTQLTYYGGRVFNLILRDDERQESLPRRLTHINKILDGIVQNTNLPDKVRLGAKGLAAYVDDCDTEKDLIWDRSYNQFGYRWVGSGCPRVSLSASVAASLLLTSLPTDVDYTKCPWPAFVMEVPRGIALHEMRPYGPDWYRHISVCRLEDGYVILTRAESDVGMLSWGDENQHEKTLSKTLTVDGAYDMTQMMAKGLIAIKDLVMAFILRMSLGKDDGASLERRHLSASNAKKLKKSPWIGDEYVYRDDVVVDLSEDVRAAALGQKPVEWSVKWFVRGHMRNQTCGPNHSLRTKTWVRPHWKGPDEKPVAIRTHVIEASGI